MIGHLVKRAMRQKRQAALDSFDAFTREQRERIAILVTASARRIRSACVGDTLSLAFECYDLEVRR